MTRPPYKRHEDTAPEQEETDFQEFVRKGREFFDRYGLFVLTFIAAVLLAYVATSWYTGREARLREDAYSELAQAASPLGKQDVASRYSHVPEVSSKAYLEAADLLLREALGMPTAPGEQPEEIGEEAREENLNRAIQLYERVIEIDHSTLHVKNARWGLAAVYENLGDFEAAAEQYAAIAETQDPYGHHLLAANYQRELDRLAEPVHFPEPQPREQPQPLFQDGGAQPGGGVDGLLDSPSLFQFDDGAPEEDLPDEPVIPETEPDADAEQDEAPTFESELDINVDENGGETDLP